MKTNIKARAAAIRTLHTYGLTPAEEAIVSLIEDLAEEIDERLEELEDEDEPAPVKPVVTVKAAAPGKPMVSAKPVPAK